jgi:hypothetical protein
MAKFTVTHSINCDADKCAKLYFDQAFNDALYKQKLGYPAFAVTSRSESDTQIVCNYTGKALGRPGSLPGPVSKMLGDSFYYKEDVTFDKSSRLGRSKCTLSAFSDQVRLEGDLRIVPVGDNQANRVLTYSLEAKVFGVGGLLESTFEKVLREEADISAALMNQWITEGQV